VTKKPTKQGRNVREVRKSLENKHETHSMKNMRISREKRITTPKTCVFPAKNRGFCKMLHPAKVAKNIGSPGGF
jgi:hypothetical protein